MRARIFQLVAVVGLFPAGVLAWASGPGDGRGGSLQRDLHRIEPGLLDVNPLAVSTREMGMDLRVPDGFSNLYQIRSDLHSRYAGQFARVSGGGGLVAVFPRGRYTEGSRGMKAEIPPDTVFLLGGLREDPSWRAESSGSQRISTKLMTMIDPRAGMEPEVRSEDVSTAVAPQLLAQQARQREFNASEHVANLFRDEEHRSRQVEWLVTGLERSAAGR